MVEAHDDVRQIASVERAPSDLLPKPPHNRVAPTLEFGGIADDRPAGVSLFAALDMQVADKAPDLYFIIQFHSF